MSAEEEEFGELRDLLAQTLERNGCIGKLRAELRANIFMSLDEDKRISQQQPTLNKKVKASLETKEGQIMFCLVRDFLEYFELDFTLSVYEPESYSGMLYKYEGRQKLMESIGAPAENSEPALLGLIKNAQAKSKTLKIDLPKVNGNHTDIKVNLEGTFVVACSEESTINGTESHNESTLKAPSGSLNGSDSSIGIGEEIASTTADHEVSKVLDQSSDSNSSSNFESKSKHESKQTKPSKLKAMNDIFPLLCTSKSLKEKTNSKNEDLDFNTEADYEEDFMSSSDLELSLHKTSTPLSLAEEIQLSTSQIRPKNKFTTKVSKQSKISNTNSPPENSISEFKSSGIS